MADQGGIVTREYRKGNWTLNETMVLIEAKKMVDERRMKKSEGKPTELRWKWVEDYCWRRGCLRSQNQCNDKWDNLMRDYKKVREYQRRRGESGSDYWEMEKNERKEKSLPTNMLRQIFEHLEQVVEKKGGQIVVAAGGASGGGSVAVHNIPYVMDTPITSVQPSLQHQLPPIPAAIPLPLTATQQLPPLPPPPTAAPTPLLQPSLSYAQPFPTVDVRESSDSDTSEHSDSVGKKRRRSGGNGEGTASPSNSNNEFGTAIFKSASIIAEAIQAREENEERRHRDLVVLHERRLQIEESKAEINRRGIEGLVDSINRLANSIIALASHKNQSAPK
ncbi:RAB isoform 1 [Hibiscus syriacus]|uniref:RAB isoform 1 n=1 Tax=Hibiscus syriacus TaxID=106335 RepID=A0A6A3CXP0_HIBSY|nr:uncharacterized protein LOC120217865 [Hibiscus syriacus]KAE8734345.1 RAB isoform 1 [Hibiscus syriacus]